MHHVYSSPQAVIVSALLAFAFPSFVHAETRHVRRGDNLQAALDAARPGDVLMLEAGAEFVGNFVLRVKSGDAPIVVRTAPSEGLPPDGVRIQPSHAKLLARIRSSNTMSALKTAPGAHHWELRYLEFGANKNGFSDIVVLGDGSSKQTTLEQIPHDLVLRHLYVHGDPVHGQKRCIALNAASVTIRDSYISDCKGVGMDTQAIAGWNGPGPYIIENNYLEGAGENVMFGGADPAVPNLVPTEIRFRGNYVSKPLAWRDPIVRTPTGVAASVQDGGSLPAGRYAYRVVARGPIGQGATGRSTATAEVEAVAEKANSAVRITWQPVAGATEYRVYGRAPGAQDRYWKVTTTSFVDTGTAGTAEKVPTSKGTVWTVKNLFELKNARNVLIENNIFENNWVQGQAGYAIVFTPRNQSGRCNWCVVESVRFEHNVVRNVAAGVNILGYDSASRPTKQTRGIEIRNNLFYDVGGEIGGNGWFMLIGDEPRDIVVDHNTISHVGTTLVYVYGGTKEAPRKVYGFKFTNNAASHNRYGMNSAYFGGGITKLKNYFPDGTITGNYLAGAKASLYPGNKTDGDLAEQFVDVEGGDFRLKSASLLKRGGTDSRDVGADIDALRTRVASVEKGLAVEQHVSTPANLRIVAGP